MTETATAPKIKRSQLDELYDNAPEGSDEEARFARLLDLAEQREDFLLMLADVEENGGDAVELSTSASTSTWSVRNEVLPHIRAAIEQQIATLTAELDREGVELDAPEVVLPSPETISANELSEMINDLADGVKP